MQLFIKKRNKTIRYTNIAIMLPKYYKYITFENKNYKVYFTGERFEYQNANRMVQANELMLAIKDDTKFVSAKKCKKRA